MSTASPAILALAQLALLVAPATVLTLLLRAARFPGGTAAAALAGGVVAGVLVGPGVLGRAAPALHQQVFEGGAAQRDAVEAVRRRQAVERAALGAAALDAPARDLRDREHAAELRPLEDALADARRRHRDGLNLLLSGLAALQTALAAALMLPVRARVWRGGAAILAEPGGWISPLVGPAAAVFSGAGAAIVGALALGLPAREALALGAVFAATGIGTLAGVRVRMAAATGMLTAGPAAVLLSWSAAWVYPLFGLFAGLLIPLGLEGRALRTTRRALRTALLLAILPAAACAVVSGFDVPSALGLSGGGPGARAFWVGLALAVLWIGEGLGLAAALAWLSAGRAGAWTLSVRLCEAVPGTIVGMLLVLSAAGVVGPALAAGVALGAAASAWPANRAAAAAVMSFSFMVIPNDVCGMSARAT
ncbi:MAG: hypothetical protein IBJ11_10415, partial [Phycisphaerales bacterium]|nr:hypothetical protein [Phycisphaerales bacterium]